MRTVLFALGALALAACSFQDATPLGTEVACTTDRDCAFGLACDRQLKRCASATVGAEVKATVSPAVGRAGTVFTAQLPADLGLTGEALLTLRTEAGVRVAQWASGPQPGAFTWTATGAEPEGTLLILLDATTAAGPLRNARVGQLALDFHAPVVRSATLALTPAADNALVNLGFAFAVERVRVGTAVAISLDVDEPLGPTASAVARCAGTTVPQLALTAVPSGSSALRLQGILSDTPAAEGSCEVELTVEDAAGNVSSGPLPLAPPLALDTTPPAPPAVDTERAVVLRRAPQGEGPDAGPSFEVRVAASAQPESAVLVVANLDGVPLSRSKVAAQGKAHVTGLTTFADPIDVLVQWVDLAGNSSPFVQVRDQDYVVLTAGLEAVGLEELTAQPVTLEMPWSPEAVPAAQGDAYVFPGDAGTLWLSTFSSAFGRVVLQSTNVPNRSQAAMAGREPVLLFGGRLADGGLSQELFVSSAYADQPSLAPTGPSRPSPREGAALSSVGYPPVTVLFGGRGATGALGDTWLYADAGWVALSPAQAPSPRSEATLYNNFNGTLWLVGGRDGTGALLGDAWSLNLFNPTTWTPYPFAIAPRANAQTGSYNPLAVSGGDAPDGGLHRDCVVLAPGGLAACSQPTGRAAALLLNDSNGQDFLEYGRGSLQRDGGFERAYPNYTLPLPGGNELLRDLPFGEYGSGYTSVAVSGTPMLLTYPAVCNDGCGFYDEAYAVEGGVLRRQRAENLGLRTAAPWSAGPVGPTVFDAQCGVAAFPCRAGSGLRARRSDGSSVQVDLEVDSGVLAGRPEWSSLAYDAAASRYVLLGGSVRSGSFAYTTSTAFKVPGQPWKAGDTLTDPRRLVAVARPGAAPLAAGAGLYELEGDRWAVRLDAGVSAVCAAWDPTHDRLYVVDDAALLRRWQSDAGLLAPVATNIQCPIAYSPELQQVVVWNHLTGLDGVGAAAKGTLTLSAAGARVDGGVLRAQVEVTLGGLGQSDGGATLPGASVTVGASLLQTTALPEAPEQVSVLVVAAPDGGAFASSGALTLRARSLGLNGAGFAKLRVTTVRAVYELRH